MVRSRSWKCKLGNIETLMCTIIRKYWYISNKCLCGNGTNISWGERCCSIQRGEAKLNGTFHISLYEISCSITRMRKHSFVLYNLYKDLNFQTNLNKKSNEKWLTQAKHYTSGSSITIHYAGNITRMLTSPPTHALHLLDSSFVEFCTFSFLLVSFLEQTSKDCIGNTFIEQTSECCIGNGEHFNVTAKYNGK